jgi:23S rRNA (cytosine1962-C5)-methyltransferase
VDRPHPAALGSRGDPGAWTAADLRFDRERGWEGASRAREPWTVRLADLTLELRPTAAGQVGLFPEHAAMLPWLRDRVAQRLAERSGGGDRPTVLNLFAYTGLASLAAAVVGAAVVHVDAARPTVSWARHDAELTGLADAPIRWIVDDARAFTAREVRRGRRYDGIIVDPPSYGHGPGSAAWQIDRDLPTLLDACARLLAPDGFALLTAHSDGYGPGRLEGELAMALGRPARAVESGPLDLETADGRRLELGAFARSTGRA